MYENAIHTHAIHDMIATSLFAHGHKHLTAMRYEPPPVIAITPSTIFLPFSLPRQRRRDAELYDKTYALSL